MIVTTPMYEKKHWDGDLADLTGQCVKVGHEMFDLFERSTTPIRTFEHYDRLSYFKTNLLLILNEKTLFFLQCVKVGHEMFDLFERSTTPIRTFEHYYDQSKYFKTK